MEEREAERAKEESNLKTNLELTKKELSEEKANYLRELAEYRN